MSERALDLFAIGLGQAGGFLCAEWKRRGYRVLALNTASGDLRALASGKVGLELPSSDVLDIADGGAGKDPAAGAQAVRGSAQAISGAVSARAKDAAAIVVMAGLGGGSGSAVGELIDVLLPLDRPIVVVATLPSDGESAVAKVNAARAIAAIVQRNIAGTFFVDNGRLLEALPGADVVSFFQKVNARVLAPLDDLNRQSLRTDTASLRAFDGEDLRRVLLSSGTLFTHTARLPDGVIAAADIMDVVDKTIDGGDILAKGGDIAQVAYAAVIVTAPEKALKAVPMQVFEEVNAELKKRTAGAAVFDGLSVGPDDQPMRCTVLLSALGLPKRVTALVDKAASEGAALQKKIAKDVPPLDTSVLDGLSLFRGTRGAGSLPPQASVSLSSTSLPPMLVTKPSVVTEILPGGSNLPSLPSNMVLPPPNAVEPELPQVPDEMTTEGEDVSSPLLSTGPHAELDEAVSKYRSGDKKVKEKIGRKWLEDSRSTDVQVRLFAVMGMVQAKDGAFRRALTRCSNDDNKEVAALASSGLDALGDVPGVE